MRKILETRIKEKMEESREERTAAKWDCVTHANRRRILSSVNLSKILI